jgi:DNA modification methylase
VYYSTKYGMMYSGDCKEVLKRMSTELKGKVNLIFTSPPFPLNRAKKYGNMTGEEYLEWIANMAVFLKDFLAPDGSIVIELGSAWERGSPTHSTLPIEALLEFKKRGNLSLCQEFVYYNPAKLPAPVEWVNKKRIRVKDTFSRIWWLSISSTPKANNRNVLVEYSTQMKKLIKSKKYNAGSRPSEYVIGKESFLKDHGGSIPGNVIIASNTTSNDNYINYCKKNGLEIHPARMPKEVPTFFIKFLTDVGDLILDPFAGSNTTGFVSEKLKRRWISTEINRDYVLSSVGRFCNVEVHQWPKEESRVNG